MYQYKPISSTVQTKLPFTQKYMRELGKSELSAVFIILMECLLKTNKQRMIENFYIKDMQINQNFGFRYQQFLKKTFNSKEQITFKVFLELQKVQDPNNIQSGEFLKAFYCEKTNKQISIPSVIEYIYKMFNVYIIIAVSLHLDSGKTSIPKDCCAILLQELDSYYSIIKEQQPLLNGNSQLPQSNYQWCSRCQYQILDKQEYFQSTFNHILCQKCTELQKKFKICIVDNCTTKVDLEALQLFTKSQGFQLQNNEQISDQNRANQPNQQANQGNLQYQTSNNYQNRQPMQFQIPQSSQSLTQYPINKEYHNCADCQRQYNIDMLFTNFCGHYYCGICANRYSGKIYQIYCKDARCGQQIEVTQLRQFFIHQKMNNQTKHLEKIQYLHS